MRSFFYLLFLAFIIYIFQIHEVEAKEIDLFCKFQEKAPLTFLRPGLFDELRGKRESTLNPEPIQLCAGSSPESLDSTVDSSDDRESLEPFNRKSRESPEVELGQIIVTSKRTQVGLNEVADNVTVISQGRIEELPARDLSEALKYIS